ncbi:hypothetical protein FKV24_000840 [Lysobacter maris]|uniref:Uncharacterized protein n=1 Tax=Marilutibacter maris TaxID=1605891 RepID=A0A508B5M6_9GAMM|nr:hypothetical protein [Lysobacter maris]KAB8198745.1 hypothetical protein FKV24_000840 [Lysobacter maris]
MSQNKTEEQTFDVEQKLFASSSLSSCLLVHIVLGLLGITGLTALLISLLVGAATGSIVALYVCTLCRPPMGAFELRTWFWDHIPTINHWLVRHDRYKFDRDPCYPANIILSPNAAVTAHLVKSGVDPNYRGLNEDTECITALHVARTVEQARVLLDAGADLNARDKYGRTPLFRIFTLIRLDDLNALGGPSQENERRVAKANHEQDSAIAQLLLDHGADPFAKDHEGRMSMIDVVCEARRNALSSIAQQARPQGCASDLPEPRRAM